MEECKRLQAENAQLKQKQKEFTVRKKYFESRHTGAEKGFRDIFVGTET